MAPRFQISHAELARVLRRAGYAAKEIEEITQQLPDPVDADRDSEILARHGVSREHLMNRMGANP